MTKISIEEAQAHLAELIDLLGVGETVIIMRGERPVARLQIEEERATARRKAGSAKGRLEIRNDDLEHLRDFAEYME